MLGRNVSCPPFPLLHSPAIRYEKRKRKLFDVYLDGSTRLNSFLLPILKLFPARWLGRCCAIFVFLFSLSDAIVLCLPMEFRVSGADNEARREGDTKDGPRVARQMVITCNERAHSAHRLSFEEEARKKKKKKIDVYTLSKRQGETMGIEMWEGSSSSFSLWRMLTYHLCLFFFFFFFKLVAFIFFSGVFLILLSAGLLRGSPPNVKVDKMVGALAKKKNNREKEIIQK